LLEDSIDDQLAKVLDDERIRELCVERSNREVTSHNNLLMRCIFRRLEHLVERRTAHSRGQALGLVALGLFAG
jgi:hypothetical protein